MANPGYVYFLATANREFVKVGCTTELDKRIRRLSIQLPFSVELIHSIETDDIQWLERLIHDDLAEYRANGEWFKFPFETGVVYWFDWKYFDLNEYAGCLEMDEYFRSRA